VIGPLPACVNIQDEILLISDNLENKHLLSGHIHAYLDHTFHIKADPSPNTAFQFDADPDAFFL
jgi:hypothetical protein